MHYTEKGRTWLSSKQMTAWGRDYDIKDKVYSRELSFSRNTQKWTRPFSVVKSMKE